ncbi:hypothetical protein L0222_14550 [bacterium]|nr:hypothetical protein [bacterium]MCI0602891.1 hypothetical protein [bacterium]
MKADLSSFYQLWLGRLPFADALRNQRVELLGMPALVREFWRWFPLSPAAGFVQKSASA